MELTKSQVQTITSTRKLLTGITNELSNGNDNPFAAGKLTQAAKESEQALFNVLNLARTYGYAEVTEAELLLEGKEEA